MPSQDSPSDEELVAAANAGDPEAFADLYRRYREWTVRLAFRFTGSREDSLDVLQEAFLYLLKKFPGFELRARFTTFLYPVVRNLSLEATRRRRAAGSPGDADAVAAPASPEALEGSRAELAAAVAALPEGQREALLLRYVDGFSLEEVAGALEIPLGTVKSRLHHALAALRSDPRARQYFLE